MAKKSDPYNPLHKRNLGESVAKALLSEPVVALPPDRFMGAGIYAIYYIGTFEAYEEIAKYNRDEKFLWPIYVGKAVPAGARKGGFGLDADPGEVLYKRLSEHASSIEQANNIELEDFLCRYLVVDDIWIPLAESLLIEKFYPVWNMKIDGFGNHDPGAGRRNQRKSSWDVLHPGRPWANLLKNPDYNRDEIHEKAYDYIASVEQTNPNLNSTDD